MKRVLGSALMCHELKERRGGERGCHCRLCRLRCAEEGRRNRVSGDMRILLDARVDTHP